MDEKTEICHKKARETENMLARMRGEMERQGSSPQDLLWVRVQAVSGSDPGIALIDLSYAAERYGSRSGAALSHQHEAES